MDLSPSLTPLSSIPIVGRVNATDTASQADSACMSSKFDRFLPRGRIARRRKPLGHDLQGRPRTAANSPSDVVTDRPVCEESCEESSDWQTEGQRVFQGARISQIVALNCWAAARAAGPRRQRTVLHIAGLVLAAF